MLYVINEQPLKKVEHNKIKTNVPKNQIQSILTRIDFGKRPYDESPLDTDLEIFLRNQMRTSRQSLVMSTTYLILILNDLSLVYDKCGMKLV